MKINRSQVKAISAALDELFNGVKIKMLGRFFRGPKIIFETIDVNPLDSLEGMFRWVLALGHPEAKVDDQQVRQLANICGNYLTAEHLKIKNRVFADIRQATSPAEIGPLINATMDEATKYVDMLLEHEIGTMQAYAERSGITQVSASLGDEDPTVVCLGVCDDRLCKYCRAMFHDPKNIRKPIPWKLREMKEGYFKAKDWDGITPYMPRIHPRCRHVISYVPPNYGMNDDGVIVYRGTGYDYYKEYHGLNKSEIVSPEADFTDFDAYLGQEP